MHLVDEEDDRAFCRRYLAQHRLQAFLELAAIFGTGDQRSHVECQQLLVFQRLRHVAIDDPQGQTLDDGGLADAGFTDQDGVVLGASRQDLDGSADFLIAADHGVELAIPRRLGQVPRIALQGVIALFRRGRVRRLALAQGLGCRFQCARFGASLDQGLGCVAAILGERDQQAFGGDKGIARRLGSGLGGGKGPGDIGRHEELA